MKFPLLTSLLRDRTYRPFNGHVIGEAMATLVHITQSEHLPSQSDPEPIDAGPTVIVVRSATFSFLQNCLSAFTQYRHGNSDN